ncbi:Carnitine O-acetyltransferase mitochondrial [Dispira parvispora]|uniref:Carnitine O-acetyltransferase mitochondrial n=1 Tax=Dispira parvispora TaxID=1520584 RepID=A0A9W8AWW4_9FUNG|nr:Carnitine O-acetyltransferase mitochondrial [Dispira parvispora]
MLENNDLPFLPVPDLQDTTQRYLRSVKPLVSSEAYQRTEVAVHEFLQPGGVGEELQRRLLSRAADISDKQGKGSWLEEWWNEYAYFSNRVSNCFYVNFYFGLQDDPRQPTQIQRAAVLTQAALNFRQELLDGSLTRDMARKTPLCMYQYRYLFNTCRYPATPRDYTIRHTPTPGEADYTHIAVACRGQFYIVETMVAKEGKDHHPPTHRMLTTDELALRFAHVQRLAATQTEVVPLGILTSDTRDQWAINRTEFLAVDPRNEQMLRQLETALFLVSLEDESPQTREEFSRACWHGATGINRYHDKCFQLLVFANARVGYCGEHSLSDGTTALRLCKYMLTQESDTALPPQSCEQEQELSLNHGSVTLLEWVTNDLVRQLVSQSQAYFYRQVAAHDIAVLEYDVYGKDNIKKLRCSPDAYVQMAIQLAYYRFHGTCRATYESAATKKYSRGRTETIRSVTEASRAWVEAMVSQASTPEDLAALCREAIAQHAQSTARCTDGFGVDRHLLGLKYCLADHEPTPALFVDPNYAATCHWNLSTSQISDECIEEYGWGEVVPDGYGIAYLVKDKSIHFNIAALCTMQAKNFALHLELAMYDMHELLGGKPLDRPADICMALPTFPRPTELTVPLDNSADAVELDSFSTQSSEASDTSYTISPTLNGRDIQQAADEMGSTSPESRKHERKPSCITLVDGEGDGKLGDSTSPSWIARYFGIPSLPFNRQSP